MDKETAKQKIQELITKYSAVLSSGKVKSYTEEETKKDFILPLFEALGWDVYSNEVFAEEHIKSAGRVDYGFSLNGRTKFYLEAKPLKADLNVENFAKQAIRYSWNRGVTWAVLTDFESIKVFNAQAISKYLGDKLYFEIKHSEYLDRFDQLWQLSKAAFQKDLIDQEAQRVGKKVPKVSVTATLYKDLDECRHILTKGLRSWNEKVPEDILDEGVQKLLDRLIFIRVAEDRGIESQTLKPLLNQWNSDAQARKSPFYHFLITKFRELDKIYNSNLFSEHTFEKWEEYDNVTEDVIKILYGKPGYYDYDFKVMPADVLGAVYENYLGYRLLKSKKKDDMIGKDAKKRKEQGIYYTPTFIVNYIVENALKPVLNNCHSIEDLKKIKVLDPACGSGSFLIKALEMINEKYKYFNNRGDELTKIQILTENICGVDLDPQAVEIARLNLLISALDSRMALPSLAKNIKNGNSLISGTDEELKKQFGVNFRDKKPFNWQEEFPEVFNQGGFDVIIGNPPYIKEFVHKDAFDGLHNSTYYQGKMDLWTMFACISIDLLKYGGTLGFIAPNNWISNAGASIFRDKLLTDGELKSFIDFGDYKVFEDAGIQTMIFVFEKKTPRASYQIDYLRISEANGPESSIISTILGNKTKIEIEPEKLIGNNITFSSSESGSIFDKIKSKKNFELTEKEVGQGIVSPQEYVIDKHLAYLKDVRINEGIFILKDSELQSLHLDKIESPAIKPFFETDEISRYYADHRNRLWIIYSDTHVNKNIDKFPKIKQHLDKYAPVITSDFKPYGLHRARNEDLFIGPSIFSIRKTERPQFSYVDFPCYVSQTYFVISSNRINLKFLTGLLNSNLVNFWLKNKGKLQGDLLQIDKGPLMSIPIHLGDKTEQKIIIDLVDKMILLNKELHELPENSEKWENTKSEIEKTDHKIDQEVYKLYELTEDEINVIEKGT